MKERETFGSRAGFILVSAGCAIGLGNVWKFPYMCGANGGAMFIFIYLLFLAILGLPILVCEFAVGRGSRQSIAKSFDVIEQKHKTKKESTAKWHRFKYIGIAGNYLLMMFYTMVGGWMLYYTYQMVGGRLSGLGTEGVTTHFMDMMNAPGLMIGWTYAAIIIAFGVCALGLQNGVEKISKVIMSLLIILMVVLALHSLVLHGSSEGIRFYLYPDLQKMKQIGIGNVIYNAMSQAFFTLGLGVGSMSIFGSYLQKDRTLLGEAGSIVILDTLVALIAGLIVIPACFAYGVEPQAGPPLLFLILPDVFDHMAGGRIWGSLFFAFMSFAALSTIIAVFENIIAITMEQWSIRRKKAVVYNLIAFLALCLPAILGYNILSGIEPLGAGTTLMDFEDFLVSFNILPMGCLIYVMFCVRKSGWGFHHFLEEVNTGRGPCVSVRFKIYMTYVLPAIIIVVYLKGYYDKFAGQPTWVRVLWMIVAVLLLLATFDIMRIRKEK